MSYSIDALKSDCYEGTSCLINKFDIRDETVLKELETTITLTKITEYSLSPIFNIFDVQHYINIHKYLFCDIYDWAGEYRTVNMCKKARLLLMPTVLKYLCQSALKDLTTKTCFKV